MLNGLTSRIRAIMKIHKISEKEALEILKEIQDEDKPQEPNQDDSYLFGSRE